MLAALAAGDAERLAPLLGNEMQAAAVSLHPGLRRTLRAGVQAGALAGIVSGSGPTCAFLCQSAAAAVDVGTEVSGRVSAARCGWPVGRWWARGWSPHPPRCDTLRCEKNRNSRIRLALP